MINKNNDMNKVINICINFNNKYIHKFNKFSNLIFSKKPYKKKLVLYFSEIVLFLMRYNFKNSYFNNIRLNIILNIIFNLYIIYKNNF